MICCLFFHETSLNWLSCGCTYNTNGSKPLIYCMWVIITEKASCRVCGGCHCSPASLQHSGGSESSQATSCTCQLGCNPPQTLAFPCGSAIRSMSVYTSVQPGPKRLFSAHAAVSLNRLQQVNSCKSNDGKGASNAINVHLRNLFGLIMAR